MIWSPAFTGICPVVESGSTSVSTPFVRPGTIYVHCARPSFTTNTSGRPSRSITAREGTMRRPFSRVASSCTSAYMPGRSVPSPCTHSERPGAPALLVLALPPTRTSGKSCSSTWAPIRRLRVSTEG